MIDLERVDGREMESAMRARDVGVGDVKEGGSVCVEEILRSAVELGVLDEDVRRWIGGHDRVKPVRVVVEVRRGERSLNDRHRRRLHDRRMRGRERGTLGDREGNAGGDRLPAHVPAAPRATA